MVDELARWAAAVGRDSAPPSFRPLLDDLARRLSQLAVDTLFSAAKLDPSHKTDALADLTIEEATAEDGVRWLRFGGWDGTVRECEWDGSAEDAEDFIVSYALDVGDDIEGDRLPYGPHLWDWPEGPPDPEG